MKITKMRYLWEQKRISELTERVVYASELPGVVIISQWILYGHASGCGWAHTGILATLIQSLHILCV